MNTPVSTSASPAAVAREIEAFLRDCPAGTAQALLERALVALREPPKVLIQMEGGLVQQVYSTSEVNCALMHLDPEGDEETTETRPEWPVNEGEVYLAGQSSAVEGAFVADVFNVLEAEMAAEEARPTGPKMR